MPCDRLASEAGSEPSQEGLGKGDLRKQDEHLLSLSNRFRDRLEIDLGFSRARNAIE